MPSWFLSFILPVWPLVDDRNSDSCSRVRCFLIAMVHQVYVLLPMRPCWGCSYVLGPILPPSLLHYYFSQPKKCHPLFAFSGRSLVTSRGFYTIKYMQNLHTLMFTLRLSGSSALPAYPGFMVMKTAQVGFRESSVPSKMNVFSFRMMACWMLRICWATTDSTSTWGENGWLMWAPTTPLFQRTLHLAMTKPNHLRTSPSHQNQEHDLAFW